MEILEYSLDEIENMIRNGEITDAKTIVGIYYLKNLDKHWLLNLFSLNLNSYIELAINQDLWRFTTNY